MYNGIHNYPEVKMVKTVVIILFQLCLLCSFFLFFIALPILFGGSICCCIRYYRKRQRQRTVVTRVVSPDPRSRGTTLVSLNQMSTPIASSNPTATSFIPTLPYQQEPVYIKMLSSVVKMPLPLILKLLLTHLTMYHNQLRYFVHV